MTFETRDYLLISYPKSLDDQLSADIEEFGFAITNRVHVNKKSGNDVRGEISDYFNAVVIYAVFKPFIDSFLDELGKQSAESLTSLLSHIFKKIREKRYYDVRLEESRELSKVLSRPRNKNINKKI